jgi:hypothetical protein
MEYAKPMVTIELDEYNELKELKKNTKIATDKSANIIDLFKSGVVIHMPIYGREVPVFYYSDESEDINPFNHPNHIRLRVDKSKLTNLIGNDHVPQTLLLVFK